MSVMVEPASSSNVHLHLKICSHVHLCQLRQNFGVKRVQHKGIHPREKPQIQVPERELVSAVRGTTAYMNKKREGITQNCPIFVVFCKSLCFMDNPITLRFVETILTILFFLERGKEKSGDRC
jgi:hypothetical protein